MSESQDKRVQVTTKPAPPGPNSRLRMGEQVLAIVRVETPTTSSQHQEVPSVN